MQHSSNKERKVQGKQSTIFQKKYNNKKSGAVKRRRKLKVIIVRMLYFSEFINFRSIDNRFTVDRPYCRELL